MDGLAPLSRNAAPANRVRRQPLQRETPSWKRTALTAGLVLAILLSVGAAPSSATSLAGPMLATGRVHTCAVTRHATVACWGYNAAGQLGTGDRLMRSRATEVPGLQHVTSVAASEDGTCAVAAARLWCWGALRGDAYDAIPSDPSSDGDGGTTTPRPVAAGGEVATVAFDLTHFCITTQVRRLRCLGGRTRGHRPTIEAVPGVRGVRQVVSSEGALCVRLAGREVRCVTAAASKARRTRWHVKPVRSLRGARHLAATSLGTVCGAFDDGSVRCARRGSDQTRVGGLGRVTALAGGGVEFCAQLASGRLHCFDVQRGKGGDLVAASAGATSVATFEERVRVARVRETATASGRACARLADGAVRCWGHDASTLGLGQDAQADAAVTVRGLTAIIAIAGGGPFSCALGQAGGVWCWGGAQGEASAAPVPISGLANVTHLSVRGLSGCAIDDAAVTRCWTSAVPAAVRTHARPRVPSPGAGPEVFEEDGSCFADATGDVTCQVEQEGDPGASFGPARSRIPGFAGVVELVSSFHTVCGRTRAAEVKCWDWRNFGYGGPKEQATPAVEWPALAGASAIGVNDRTVCAILSTTQGVRCQSRGRTPLGTGRAPDGPAVDVPGIQGATALTVGEGGGCALAVGGTVRCWGSGYGGRLGDGPAPSGHGPQQQPTQVVGLP